MFDGLVSGIIGGTFGPIVSSFLRRHGYIKIFITSILVFNVISFFVGSYRVGFKRSMEIMFTGGLTLAGVMVPVGIAFGVVVFAWLSKQMYGKSK